MENKMQVYLLVNKLLKDNIKFKFTYLHRGAYRHIVHVVNFFCMVYKLHLFSRQETIIVEEKDINNSNNVI